MLNTISLITKNKNFKKENDVYFKISKEVVYIFSPIEKIELFLNKKNLEIKDLEIKDLKELNIFIYKETDIIYEISMNSKKLPFYFKNKSMNDVKDHIKNIIKKEKESPSHIEIYLTMKNTLIRDG